MPITYQKSGVDPEKAAKILGDFGRFLSTRPRDPALLSGIGPFAACYSLKEILNRYEDPILVTCCDGVGTKGKLALDWGDISGLGQDLVAMNVNDLLCAGADPMLFLDYYACGHLEDTQLTTLLKSIQSACEASFCSLAGGETAEMPGLYQKDDFDLAGFSIGMADRKNLYGPSRVKNGDSLVALASSGAHSNGYSLIRKLVDKAKLSPSAKTPFNNRTWKETLLEPTTLYVALLKGWNRKVHALAHLTGGGLFENLPRVLPAGARAHVRPWQFSGLFEWIQATAEISTQDMLSTFNCGVGMLVVCPPEVATELVKHASASGVPAWETGTIELTPSEKPPEILWG
ncbi:phosphoribosylformylglycinamidine cyclo-ligase [bacterium]|nr:phosphoribosylformylglycinamidine cyclo-ligase [bacterium]